MNMKRIEALTCTFSTDFEHVRLSFLILTNNLFCNVQKYFVAIKLHVTIGFVVYFRVSEYFSLLSFSLNIQFSI